VSSINASAQRTTEMTGKGLTVALSMLSVTSASYSLAQSMVNPALGTLRQTLHTDQVGVSWVLTS
jgi:hypothetical protein